MRIRAKFDPAKTLERVRQFARQFEMPWLPDDPNRAVQTETLSQVIAHGEAIPPGATARSHTSMLVPPQIPDLIGVRERRYLDHTGLVRHNSIGDLMRYSTMVQDLLSYARYGDTPPAAKPEPDAMDRRIGTDPRYALQSRKGTGYYKVPSLRGVWYRGPFEHNGRVATLEEWFDPARKRFQATNSGRSCPRWTVRP